MNITASKLLLGVSLAAYTYASWDHMFTSREKPAPPPKGKELAEAMVTRYVPLELARDPFDSTPLERGAVASGSFANDSGKSLGQLTLQAILLMPMGRVAMVNGKALHEGEVVQLEPGAAAIRAKKVGEDYVVLEGGGNLTMLRIEDNDKNKPAAAHNERTGGTGTGTGTGTGSGTGGGPRVAAVRPNER